jgi:hypothetical protein
MTDLGLVTLFSPLDLYSHHLTPKNIENLCQLSLIALLEPSWEL